MQYTVEFMERLKAEFPNEPHLHKMAECGSKDLSLLIKPGLDSLTPAKILEFLNGGYVDELQAYCEAYERRLALYYEAVRFAFGAPIEEPAEEKDK